METELGNTLTPPTAREAKESLVGRIVSRAKRDGVPLSDVERKIMYFSETAWTLPDMAEVSREFDQHYDQDEFERKIARLIQSIRREQVQDEGGKRNWKNAMKVLRREDHYLLVLIDARNVDDTKPRPPPGTLRDLS
jgi:hypothetical protein